MLHCVTAPLGVSRMTQFILTFVLLRESAFSRRAVVRAVWFALALLLSVSAQAIEPAPFAATVDIDTQGSVTAVRQLSTPISPTLQAKLAEQLRQWRFEPAMQDGKPVAWSTTLFGNVPPMGGWPNYFRHGPRPLVSTPPRYPKSSLGMQISTRSLIEADVDANGRVSAARVVAVSSYPGDRNMAMAMASAAELAVRSWQFEPETRAGLPVASRVLVPIGIRPRQYVGASQWVYHLGTAADFDMDRVQMGVLSHADGPRFMVARQNLSQLSERLQRP